MTLVYIGVGANIDAEAHITAALRLLGRSIAITAVSPFYRSKAVGLADQPDFINGVLAAATSLEPRTLKFDLLRRIEEKLGRARTAEKNAARPIDLDVLLYGALVLSEPDFTVPDPGLRRYSFAAVPLLALAPDLVLPGSGERLRDLFPRVPAAYGLEYLPTFSRNLTRLLGAPEKGSY